MQRKRFANKKAGIFTILFALALGLSGCGSSQTTTPSAENATPAATSATPAQAADTESRIIKHAMGETEIKGTPQRVAILTNEGTEALLAVGVKPVGAVMSWSGEPWYDHIKAEMDGVTVVGDELQPNVELIASLKPDLIIGNKVRQEKIYDQLSKIAPTVFAADLSGQWKNNFALYTEALNKKAEGEKAMQAYDQHAAEVKEKLSDKLNTKVSVARFTVNQVRIYQKDTFSGVILNQLGFARPASQDKDQFMEVITKERIPDLDGDILFYFTSDDPGSNESEKVVKDWMADPLFANLNVAKANRVVHVNEVIWNTAGGIKAANLLLDDLVKQLEK